MYKWKEIADENKVSILEISYATKVSTSNLYNWIKGRSAPNLQTSIDFYDAFSAHFAIKIPFETFWEKTV